MIILRRGERPSYFLFLKGEIFESGRWLNYNANWVPKLTEFHMLNLEHWLERTWTPNIRASMKLGTLETLHSAPSFANKRNTLIPEISSRLPEGNVSSVQFSRSIVSNSFWPHGLQHARPPCPTPTPRACVKLVSIESVTPSNHLILCRPLLLPPLTFPSIRIFSSESVLRIR